MSFSTLWIGVSGLTAAQRAMETAAHNVANVNTDGYSRQRVELRAAPPVPGTFGTRGDGMRGTGVTVADVIRIRSGLVDAAFRAEAGSQAGWSARAEVMARAEQLLGPMGGGAPAALAEFWAGWEELSLGPDNPAARRGVIDAGETLARWLRSAAADLDRLGSQVAAALGEAVDEVNRITGQIARLNAGIADAVIGAQAPNDLMDERDRLLDRLAALTGAAVRPAEFGTVDVFVGTRALVRGESVEGIAISGTVPAAVTWSPGGEPVALAGRLGALVEAGTTTLVSLGAELDAVAAGLIGAVNGLHAAGFDLDGAPGGAFFTGSGAGDIAVAVTDGRRLAASAGGVPTDGNHALAMAALRGKPAVGDPATVTVEDALGAFAGRLGSLAAEAMDAAAAGTAVLNGLRRERADVASVSTDEELADMIRFQRSYEAAARVVTTVDEMLDRLINHTGLVGR